MTDEEQKKLTEIENYRKQRTRREKKLRGMYDFYIFTFYNRLWIHLQLIFCLF